MTKYVHLVVHNKVSSYKHFLHILNILNIQGIYCSNIICLQFYIIWVVLDYKSY